MQMEIQEVRDGMWHWTFINSIALWQVWIEREEFYFNRCAWSTLIWKGG